MLFNKKKKYKNAIGDTVKITQFITPVPNAFYVENQNGVDIGSLYIELEPNSLIEINEG